MKASVTGRGPFELYRDLLSPGGVSKVIPGAVLPGAGRGVRAHRARAHDAAGGARLRVKAA